MGIYNDGRDPRALEDMTLIAELLGASRSDDQGVLAHEVERRLAEGQSLATELAAINKLLREYHVAQAADLKCHSLESAQRFVAAFNALVGHAHKIAGKN